MKLNYFAWMLMVFTVVACNNGGSDKSESKKDEGKSSSDTTTFVEDGQLRIAFVNVDSVSSQYKRIIDANRDANAMVEEGQKQIRQLEQNFQAYYMDVQKRYSLMLKDEQAAAERKLQNMEANLKNKQAEFQQKLANFENKVTLSNFNNLYAYIEKYAKEHGYDYVLSKKFGGEFLYGNPAYDITKDVIEGINKEYDASLDTSVTAD